MSRARALRATTILSTPDGEKGSITVCRTASSPYVLQSPAILRVVVPRDSAALNSASWGGNFAENVAAAFPLLESLVIGQRRSDKAIWLNRTQRALNTIIRRIVIFSSRSGRGCFVDTLAVYNNEFECAVVFDPCTGGSFLQHYIEKSHSSEGRKISIIGCFSDPLDKREADPEIAENFGRPGPNVARAEVNAMKHFARALRKKMGEYCFHCLCYKLRADC